MNVLCGVGILSIPYAVKTGGWLNLILLLAMGSISFYTGILLKICLDSSPGLETYPDVGDAAFGLAGRVLTSVSFHADHILRYILILSSFIRADSFKQFDTGSALPGTLRKLFEKSKITY